MTSSSNQLLPAIQSRKSFRSFTKQALTEEQIAALFEAARLAPSSMNAQPWSYVYATPENKSGFEKIVSALLPANKTWAKNAALLIVCTAAKHYDNGTAYTHAWHDTGLANAQLVLQATYMGLFAHFIGGINFPDMQKNVSVPDTHEVICVIAIGYQGDGSDLESEQLKQREQAAQIRKPLEIVARIA